MSIRRNSIAVAPLAVLVFPALVFAQSWSGTGYAILDFAPLNAPALVRVTGCAGEDSYLFINSYGIDGYFIDYVARVYHPYDGIVPLNFNGTNAKRFIVYSDDAWTIQIMPLSAAHTLNVPGTLTGNTDDVILLTGGVPEWIDILQNAYDGGFYLNAYDANANYLDTIVETGGPFYGTLPVPQEAAIFKIRNYYTESPYTLTISGVAGPTISQLSARTPKPGYPLTIRGSGFGTNKKNVAVHFGSKRVDSIKRISNSSIRVTIPRVRGTVGVYVKVDGIKSNTVPLQIKQENIANSRCAHLSSEVVAGLSMTRPWVADQGEGGSPGSREATGVRA